MPIPIILGVIAGASAAVGVGTGIHGGVKMKGANDTMQAAKKKQEKAIWRFEEHNEPTVKLMDRIGEQELKILSTFDDFSDIIEKIQGRPEFKAFKRDGIDLPKYEAEELKKVSVGAEALLAGVGGAAAGTAGGFAAAGATSAAVMALGTASTGTAISTLSGVAATNAALAALGGGSLAAGGGGIALGTTLLGASTLGVGLLIGGVIFGVTGSKLSDKADEALKQATRTEEEVDRIVVYLDELFEVGSAFKRSLSFVDTEYWKNLNSLRDIVIRKGKTQWNQFSKEEKKLTENTVLLVGLLYKMCQVKLVLKQDNEHNKVNSDEVYEVTCDAQKVLREIA